MGDFIDITQFSVAVSCFGIFMIGAVLGVRPSKSWESSAGFKKFLLIFFGLGFQIPVIIVVVSKPAVVTDVLATEPWSYKNLLINYAVMLGIGLAVYLLSAVFGRYDASK
jgi:Sec-independent protein secretion pathway component TatC